MRAETKKNQTQVLSTYEVFSFELHNNYSKNTHGTEHAHLCKYTSNNYTCKREQDKFFVEAMIMLTIFISLYNGESLRSSNKLVNFLKN